jgi:trehalose synthase
VPLLRDAGIAADWQVIEGAPELFEVTKRIHNALQGDGAGVSPTDWATWERWQRRNAEQLAVDDYDVIVVHDPQPAGIARLLADGAGSARWMWRCHIDLSTPEPDARATLLPWLEPYPLSLFHRAEYVPGGFPGATRGVPPAIDPLQPKNIALDPIDARHVTAQFGIDPARPLVTQVSRFDPWKDPLGVVDAWRIAREQLPGLQLALIGALAADDPEGARMLELTRAHAAADPDVHLLTDQDGIGPIEVNAFQVCSDVLLQKSLREGFGLTVTEALWKARPVIGGNVGGIRSQLVDHETGWLVDSVDQAAEAIVEALREPEAALAMARMGKEQVRERFLITRYVTDHLACYGDLLQQ